MDGEAAGSSSCIEDAILDDNDYHDGTIFDDHDDDDEKEDAKDTMNGHDDGADQ